MKRLELPTDAGSVVKAEFGEGNGLLFLLGDATWVDVRGYRWAVSQMKHLATLLDVGDVG